MINFNLANATPVANTAIVSVDRLLVRLLPRLCANAAMGRDSFTKNCLAVASHVSPIQVENWIVRGLLKVREVQTCRIKRVIIAAEDCCEFCTAHTKGH